ncbi:MAG: hypothetical protein MZV63_62000 [Marinilabiliales bacterium]|nr:hypothetical protein [Marinilabiliales bacterium]
MTSSEAAHIPNNKAKHLRGMAEMIVNRFGGVVPSEADELTQLPGVGRKTANVITSVVWNKPGHCSRHPCFQGCQAYRAHTRRQEPAAGRAEADERDT